MLKMTMLFAALSLGLGSAVAAAQTQSAEPPPARSPVNGDPVARAPRPVPVKPLTRAARDARADKQPPGVENGNQPDRAQAGGGGR